MKSKSLQVLILLAAFVLSSCAAPQQSKKHTVYLYGAVPGDIFTAETANFNMTDDEQTAAFSPPWQISLPLGDGTVVLQHDFSKPGYHKYCSEDKDVACEMDSQTGALDVVGFWDKAAALGISCVDQDAFVESFKRLLSCYCQEDWSNYKMTIQSSKVVRGETSTGIKTTSKERYEGFIAPEEDARCFYLLSFRREIDGNYTTDEIRAYYWVDSDVIILWFSPHKFDNVNSIALDTEGIRTSVDSFLRNSVNETRFALQGYELENPVVVRIDNQLYYKYDVSLDLQVQTAEGETKDVSRLYTIIAETGIDVSHAPVGTPPKPYQVLVAEKPADYVEPTEPTEPVMTVAPTEPVDPGPELYYKENPQLHGFVYAGTLPTYVSAEAVPACGWVSGGFYFFDEASGECQLITELPLYKPDAFRISEQYVYFILEGEEWHIWRYEPATKQTQPGYKSLHGEPIIDFFYLGEADSGVLVVNENNHYITVESDWKQKRYEQNHYTLMEADYAGDLNYGYDEAGELYIRWKDGEGAVWEADFETFEARQVSTG